MKMKVILAGLLASLALVGCTTTKDFLNDHQDEATQAASNRGKFEFSCDAVSATVLNRKTIELYPVEMPQYQVGIAGCGKKEVYIVNCNPESGCMVYDSAHDFLKDTKKQDTTAATSIE
ncbi:hypothetical protein [Vibrio superstes]|uniref:Lipoprotein n=1 Tax=Vibrio superstes NBRC 103154 TaxID=1219062 RepID=A0A511QR47_9VIBR|nr:hypothetical protein [Vibrio superstes]GEM79800.1 hypothetical protein VSU01S_20450 [Vibrio superstes NBRC 103154]